MKPSGCLVGTENPSRLAKPLSLNSSVGPTFFFPLSPKKQFTLSSR